MRSLNDKLFNAAWRIKYDITNHKVATVTGLACVGAMTLYAVGYFIRAVKK